MGRSITRTNKLWKDIQLCQRDNIIQIQSILNATEKMQRAWLFTVCFFTTKMMGTAVLQEMKEDTFSQNAWLFCGDLDGIGSL